VHEYAKVRDAEAVNMQEMIFVILMFEVSEPDRKVYITIEHSKLLAIPSFYSKNPNARFEPIPLDQHADI
jgi:hypothetical protein